MVVPHATLLDDADGDKSYGIFHNPAGLLQLCVVGEKAEGYNGYN